MNRGVFITHKTLHFKMLERVLNTLLMKMVLYHNKGNGGIPEFLDSRRKS